jgi:hypothetical protein
MSFYFPNPFGVYVEVNVPRVESSNNVVCCVDTSGSMAGAPLKGVCSVLREVWSKTHIPYSVVCYNTAVSRTTVEAVAASDLSASGGTSFRVVFDAMRDTLVSSPVATTFIFMTDGQDTGGDPASLKRSMDTLRLVISGLKGVPITVHAVGFGEVDADFLNRVRCLGSKEGVFRFASAAAELAVSFNDLFEYAAAAREVTLTLAGKTHTAYGNEGSVGFLLQERDCGLPLAAAASTAAADAAPAVGTGGGAASGGSSELAEGSGAAVSAAGAPSAGASGPVLTATVTAAGAPPAVVAITRLAPSAVTPLRALKALNLVVPEEEAGVRAVLKSVHDVAATGTSVLERMEVAQLKADVAGRMMEYLGLLTQIKMGQVRHRVESTASRSMGVRSIPHTKLPPLSRLCLHSTAAGPASRQAAPQRPPSRRDVLGPRPEAQARPACL